MLGFDTSPEYFDKAVNPQMYEAIDAIARYNLIKRTKYSGISLYASKDSQVHHNTLINTNYSGEHGMLYFGISYQDYDTDAKRPPNVNPSIHYNIFYEEGSHTYANNAAPENDLTAVAIRKADEEQLGELSALYRGMDIDYNCYFIVDKSKLDHVGTLSVDFSDQRSDWRGDFNQWKSHISGDRHSKESNPLFDARSIAQSSACQGMGYAQP